MSAVRVLCTANSKRSGRQCRALALKGSEPLRCRTHIGSKKARTRAEVRAELQAWRVGDETADPNQVLLRLMTQSFRRAAYYGWLLEEAQNDAGTELKDLIGTLIGHKIGAAGKDGVLYEAEEAIRGLVTLEGQERDRAARFAKLAIDAGIADRIVKLEEDKAAAVVGLIRRVLVALGHNPADPATAALVGRELRALEAGEA
jgi:hypothetical protein